jgi:radical SAM protein with 4Fe4S-binding SPASM domain
MTSYFYINRENVGTFFNDLDCFLSIEKFVIIDKSVDISLDEISNALSTKMATFSNMYLRIGFDEFFINRDLLIRKGIFNLVCFFEPKNSLNFETLLNSRNVSDYHKIGDLQKFSDAIKYTSPDFNILPEVIIPVESVENLFPYIATLVKGGFTTIEVCCNKLDIQNESDVFNLRNSFKLIESHVMGIKQLSISHSSYNRKNWQARINTSLEGPTIFDIDVANTCTHNCVFCGLYSDVLTANFKKNDNESSLETEQQKFLSLKINPEDCHKLIRELNNNVESITFGGAGDPFTHPDILSFIEKSRNRGFRNQIYSNYAYMSESKLLKLHELASIHPDSVHFIVNLSGATSKIYNATRPNQSEKTYQRVIKHLRLSSDLRKRDGKGVSFKIMAVINKLNFHEMHLFAILAKYVQADSLWCKSMELHGEATESYLIKTVEDKLKYAYAIEKLLILADKLDLNLTQKEAYEVEYNIQKSNLDSIRDKNNIWDDIERDINSNFEILDMYEQLELDKHSTINYWESFHSKFNLLIKPQVINKIEPNKVVKISRNEVATETIKSLEVSNSSLPSLFYSKLPCTIGYQYMRIKVDGSVLPCCISNYEINNIKDNSWRDIWRSGQYESFRGQVKGLPQTLNHLKSSEWLFCQQCTHFETVSTNNRDAGYDFEIID